MHEMTKVARAIFLWTKS